MNYESVLIDVEQGISRAARPVKLPQAHRVGEPEDEPLILRAEDVSSVRGQVQPCWRPPVFDGVAHQLSSHEALSPVGDRCIRLLANSVFVTLALSVACCNTSGRRYGRSQRC